ncbi:MAG: helix-turn-helix domain-containing protein [Planctomycetes bacterium]|nr:helix-turn-helix domain-containing protein [Planctomycetota bacterium]
MTAGGSVTNWIAQLRAGEETALGELHKRYWPFLVQLAHRKLKGASRRAMDEQDVAQEAFWGFYESLKKGRLPRLANRHDLIALFVIITSRKAAKQIRREYSAKRGGGQVQGESVLARARSAGDQEKAIERLPDPAPTPYEQAVLNDCYVRFVEGLPDSLRRFAEHFLAGYSHKEIADAIGCSERTVDRKVPLILNRWRKMAAEGMRDDRPE